MSQIQYYSNHSSVDQSDRTGSRNLRQTGDADIGLVISTLIQKSPFWHLSADEGFHEATMYNLMYHLRAYIDLEDGGSEAEYELLGNHVALWAVTVEHQIRVEGSDAEEPGEPVCATLATVPLKQSANPSAHEQVRMHSRETMEK